MKPQDAAAVMAQLDDKVRLPIAAGMKPAVLSAILGKMGTLEAKDLTESWRTVSPRSRLWPRPPTRRSPGAPAARRQRRQGDPPPKGAKGAPRPNDLLTTPAADDGGRRANGRQG